MLSYSTVGDCGESTHGHVKDVVGVDFRVKLSGLFICLTIGSFIGGAFSGLIISILRTTFLLDDRGDSTHGQAGAVIGVGIKVTFSGFHSLCLLLTFPSVGLFVQEFGLLVGRSLVHADADDWKVSILLYNSDPCARETKHCKCNPVTIPARTRIARVEEIQAIQNIGTRTTESSEGEDVLPPHLVSVLDTASELTSDQRTRAATLLAKHVNTFPAPGTLITSRTDAVVHEIDTGSTRPI